VVHAVLLCLVAGSAELPLKRFVSAADPSFAWKASTPSHGRVEIQLTSQTWQGKPWCHTLSVTNLDGHRGTAVLVVTGDRVDRADLPFMDRIARHSGLLTATLFDVPNQPLFDGLEEDALIAFTFGKFLETEDSRWPLLFPMTKSVVRAMDALQKWDPSIKRFVITGASKRGWTTWLAAATGDRRVAGIAPMVFDFLGFEAQLKHQLDAWGKYSEMLADYVSQGQAEAAATPRGRALSAMVDPYAYLSSFKMPKLIVLGANDRYWTADAHQLYAPKLPGRTYFRIVPNAGHNLNGGVEAAGAIAYFAQGVARRLPRGAQGAFDAGRVSTGPARAWIATSETKDFRDSTWSNQAGVGKWRAEFAEYPLTPWASFTSGVSVRENR
jgi:PhoPQ-activated pathogenicity-related protein